MFHTLSQQKEKEQANATVFVLLMPQLFRDQQAPFLSTVTQDLAASNVLRYVSKKKGQKELKDDLLLNRDISSMS